MPTKKTRSWVPDDELEEALAEAARSILRRLDADEAWLPTLDGDSDPWSHVADAPGTSEEPAPKKRRQSDTYSSVLNEHPEWKKAVYDALLYPEDADGNRRPRPAEGEDGFQTFTRVHKKLDAQFKDDDPTRTFVSVERFKKMARQLLKDHADIYAEGGVGACTDSSAEWF